MAISRGWVNDTLVYSKCNPPFGNPAYGPGIRNTSAIKEVVDQEVNGKVLTNCTESTKL